MLESIKILAEIFKTNYIFIKKSARSGDWRENPMGGCAAISTTSRKRKGR